MNRTLFAVLLLLLGVLCLAWYFYANQADLLAPQPVGISGSEPPPPVAEPVAPREALLPQHPVAAPDVTASPDTPSEPPFPEHLDQADAYLQLRLPQLGVKPDLLQLLALNHFIEKLVLIIDKLPEASLPRPHLPIAPPKPGFQTTMGSAGLLVISGRNAARYTPYVRLAEAIPDAALLKLYRGLYPLFQQAYADLGHPDGYFNDRLIEVFDHLLQTPEPAGAIPLVSHVTRFKYADAALEALSVGQKTLLRMGSDNARRIKAKLSGLRQGLLDAG